jgi:hypothetical protein
MESGSGHEHEAAYNNARQKALQRIVHLIIIQVYEHHNGILFNLIKFQIPTPDWY